MNDLSFIQNYKDARARLFAPRPKVAATPVAAPRLVVVQPPPPPETARPAYLYAYPIGPKFPKSRMSVTEILEEVALKHGISVDTILQKSRKQELAHARQEAMYTMALRTNLSYPAMGSFLGGMDHTTVLHGIKAHCNRNGLEHPRVPQLRNDPAARIKYRARIHELYEAKHGALSIHCIIADPELTLEDVRVVIQSYRAKICRYGRWARA